MPRGHDYTCVHEVHIHVACDVKHVRLERRLCHYPHGQYNEESDFSFGYNIVYLIRGRSPFIHTGLYLQNIKMRKDGADCIP